ncbi:hypothetical protein Fmac_017659 [Flemingia macrophylla]|uniref:Uncharacterized protein n=1 Tax=Flemingia macrophylla TaxID=520843 RepID=A0ABD1M3E6_9FABA
MAISPSASSPKMKRHAFSFNPFTFFIVFAALSLVVDRKIHCHQFHCEVLKWGMLVVSSLFDQVLPCLRDQPSWITIIVDYVRNDDLAAVGFGNLKVR